MTRRNPLKYENIKFKLDRVNLNCFYSRLRSLLNKKDTFLEVGTKQTIQKHHFGSFAVNQG